MNKQLWGEHFDDRWHIKPKKKSPPCENGYVDTNGYNEGEMVENPAATKKRKKNVKPAATTNPIVKQTIEVMDQSDIITDLLEIYKPGSNPFFNNQCHATPNLEVYSTCDINMIKEQKCIKPLWFIPPGTTNFTTGKPIVHKTISAEFLRKSLRKSVAGLLRIKNFKDSTNSSLHLMVDAVDEFYKNFMEQIRFQLMHQSVAHDSTGKIGIVALEKSYYNLTKSSLLTLYNYYKTDMIRKNRNEIDEFKTNYHEYDRVTQMIQKPPNIKEEDLASYLDCTDSNSYIGHQVMSTQNLFDGGESSSLGEIFDREFIHSQENLNLSIGPSSSEN